MTATGSVEHDPLHCGVVLEAVPVTTPPIAEPSVQIKQQDLRLPAADELELALLADGGAISCRELLAIQFHAIQGRLCAQLEGKSISTLWGQHPQNRTFCHSPGSSAKS
jgi:hypothetical protein